MAMKETNYKRLLEQSLGIPFTSGNKVEILKNGIEIFPSMLDAIRNAKERVEFLTYVYWSGDIAEEFAAALSKKAQEGVEVYVILDSFGCASISDELISMMEESGVEVEWFRPVVRLKIWKSDNRTHRKVLICDGDVAFTGGVGIAEEWEGDARNENEWRETHFRIEGPAVYGLQAAFMENWIETGRPLQFDEERGSEQAADGATQIQVIRTAASVRWSDIVMLYHAIITMAQKKIRICTAYFNPDETIIKLLKEASARGVEVEIMLPGKTTDQEIARIAGNETFESLLEEEISIWYYQKTMLHCKVITIDGVLSCVGSANFNHRSMLKDDEINVVILDKEICIQLNAHFDEDLRHCEKVDKERWKNRGLLKRSLEKASRVIKKEV